jgi:hypothetical protein
VLPGLPSNENNSSDHHNSYNKGPNLAFFSFTESPSNSLPTIKFPKNRITSSYHSNMPETAKAKIWPLGTLGVKPVVSLGSLELMRHIIWDFSLGFPDCLFCSLKTSLCLMPGVLHFVK